ncbi:MAG TPA: hypothetical protein ENK67_00285 [Flavobacteriia bacterium]|jgi:c-di-AMP phosphodiesterase-like protein|nr:hypothetical protein [Flavobacteriia bacterium]
MLKLYKIIEYLYLGFALFFIVEAIRIFSTDSKKGILFLFFAVMATFMFFFKRRFRKKRFKNKDSNK